MSRPAWVTGIGQGSGFIPVNPMKDVTHSEPFLRGGIYHVRFHYRAEGKKTKARTTRSTGQRELRAARSAAQTMYDEFRVELDRERIAQSDKAPLGPCVQDYLARRSSSLAPRTEKQYRCILERLASTKHIHPDTPLCSITRRQCEEFFGSLKGTYRGKKITHNPHTAGRVVRAFFNWLVDEGRLQSSPVTKRMIKELRPATVVQDYFHEELEEFAEFWVNIPDDTYRERTSRNLFYLAFATGLRVSDVCKLQESQIDYKHGLIIVSQEKTGECVRCFISPQVADALALQARNKTTHKDSRVRESEWLFPSDYRQGAGLPFAPRTVEEAFLEARRMFLPLRKGLHFHSLRHSFGQNAYNYTGQHDSISVAMGHQSPAVTLAHYATNARYVETPQRYGTFREYLWSRPVLSRLSRAPILGTLPEQDVVERVRSSEPLEELR